MSANLLEQAICGVVRSAQGGPEIDLVAGFVALGQIFELEIRDVRNDFREVKFALINVLVSYCYAALGSTLACLPLVNRDNVTNDGM